MLVAVTRQDGGLSITTFVADAPSDAEIAAELVRASIAVASWRRIDASDVPADRTYRDAWTDDGKTISVDPTKQVAIDAERAAAPDLRALQAALVAKGVITDADVTAAGAALPAPTRATG